MKEPAGQRNTDCKPIAVGVVRGEVSGLNAQRHAFEVRSHAERLGYRYAYTVRPPGDHEDPVEYALGIASSLGAEVIIVYDLATVGHSPARVCELFDLETVSPPQTWARARRDEPHGQPAGAGVRLAETA